MKEISLNILKKKKCLTGFFGFVTVPSGRYIFDEREELDVPTGKL
jgi:hypothetical protein